MRTARLFRTIWRVNGVLLLLAFLLVGGVALVAVISSARWSRRADTSAPAVIAEEAGERLFLGRLQEIDGTSFILLPLEAREPGSKFASGSSYERETRNLLFYDAATGAARWLRPDHKAVILEHEFLRERAPTNRPSTSEEDHGSGPVRWIRYELATADTNSDGEITDEDARQVAVSGPGAEGLTVAVSGVDEVLGYAAPRNGRLIVFFRRGAETFAGEIDLTARKLLRTTPLPKS